MRETGFQRIGRSGKGDQAGQQGEQVFGHFSRRVVAGSIYRLADGRDSGIVADRRIRAD